jgi:glycosyltransferase involved in cell wall biosynthesis
VTAAGSTGGEAVVLAPGSWARPLDWLPGLSAHIAAVAPQRDATLYLDARAADVEPLTVRMLVQRACAYLSDGLEFGQVVLLEGAVDTPPESEPVGGPAELLERLGVEVAPLEETPFAITQHARWVKVLVDALQADIDRSRLEAAPRVAVGDLPLVSVPVAAYGSADALRERALPSVLAGAYPNIEVLVCSEDRRPDARAAVEAIGDPRLRYVELGEGPAHPSRPQAFAQSAGAYAVNRLMDEARGACIAPLDHDEAFTVDHMLFLLDALRRSGGDFVCGVAMSEDAGGAWRLRGSPPFARTQVFNGTVMYSSRLIHMRRDPLSWLLDEPADWNLWRRMRDTGASIHHVVAAISVHFKRPSDVLRRERDQPVFEERLATDILETSACELLRVSSRLRGARGLPVRPNRRRPVPPAPRPRRLAWLDTHFPLWLSGFRWHEAKAMRELLPDMAFFSGQPTGQSWPVPVHALAEFPAIAGELGITDVYCVFLNFTVSLLGLQGHPGTATCAGIPPDMGIAPALWNRGVRLHTTLYPGGGLVSAADPELLRLVAARSETVFTNTAEVVAAIPEAIRIAGPMGTAVYEYRPRPRGRPFRLVFAADDRPRKGLDTALAAFALLDDRFHLDIAGPNERYLEGIPQDRITLHGILEQAKLRDLYWAADAFVSPVRPEGTDGPPEELGLVDGFPTSTACEALASGCALISANPRGEDWIVRDGEHYLEIPVQDHVALAEALDLLERDRDLRDRLAEHGAARVREVMDASKVARAKVQAMGFAVASPSPSQLS